MAGSATITGKQHYVAGIGHPQSEPSTECPPAMLVTDSTSNNVWIAGADEVNTLLVQPKAAMNRVGLVGDSRSDDVDGSYGTYDRQRPARNWLNLVLALTGNSFDLVGTSVKAGYRTDQYLVGLDALIEQAPDCIIFGYPCVNDLFQNYPSASTSADTAIANLTTAIDKVLAAGIRVIAFTEPGATSLDATMLAQCERFNQKYIEFFETRRNAFLFDARPIHRLQSGTGSTLAFKPLALYDTTHYSASGSLRLARAFVDWARDLGIIGPSRENSYLGCSGQDTYTNNSIDLIDNALFLTATGGTATGFSVTGGIPSGCNIVSTTAGNVSSCTSTVASDSTGYGNSWTVDIAVSNVNDIKLRYSIPIVRLAGESYVEGGVKIELLSGTGVCMPALQLYPQPQAESLFPEPLRAATDVVDALLPITIAPKNVLYIPDVGASMYAGVVLKFPGAGSASIRISRLRAKKRFTDQKIVSNIA
jgi:hypothetical protein